MNFLLTSTAFEDGRPIPRRFTGEGDNISPPLKWTDPPDGTRSLALVVEDPDAPRGTFGHWVVFNIPAVAREVSEATPQVSIEPNGMMQGRNDAGGVGYTGPKPPPGKPHHYHFRLFALDQFFDLPEDTDREGLLDAINGHTLAEADLTGTYVHGQQEGVTDNPFEKKALQDAESLHTAPLA